MASTGATSTTESIVNTVKDGANFESLYYSRPQPPRRTAIRTVLILFPPCRRCRDCPAVHCRRLEGGQQCVLCPHSCCPTFAMTRFFADSPRVLPNLFSFPSLLAEDVAKDSNNSLGDRASAGIDALGDKAKESKQ